MHTLEERKIKTLMASFFATIRILKVRFKLTFQYQTHNTTRTHIHTPFTLTTNASTSHLNPFSPQPNKQTSEQTNTQKCNQTQCSNQQHESASSTITEPNQRST